MAATRGTSTLSPALRDGVNQDTTTGAAATSTTASSHKDDDADGKADVSQPETTQPNDDQTATPPFRRSLRRSSRSTRQSNQMASTSEAPKKRLDTSQIVTESSRRNPKRKASEPSRLLEHLPEDLLSEALRPLEPKDIEEWEGWVELESEPAFFNIILRDLGVANVKAQELFSIDQDSLGFLPKPIFGLIFLFQYHAGLDETQDEEDAEGDLWFANQTTHNACATVSLLNIILNVPKVDLGEPLTKFKESTESLSTALRGHRLSSDPFLRTIHNSFTRRMDHLNADLALENETNEPKPKKVKGGARKGTKSGGKAKKKVIEDFAFHFIGYVERDGYVWELDGLKTKPLKLGPVEKGDWTSVARPQINARMCQYEDEQLSFNLLALCQSPLATHSRKIAERIAALRHLHLIAQLKEGVGDDWMPEESIISQADNTDYLAEFRLTPEDVLKAEIPAWVRDQVSEIDTTEKATALHQDLEVEAKATIGEFRAEMTEMAQDEQRVKGRKQDYGLALHKWVSKLAEKGVLGDLIAESRA